MQFCEIEKNVKMEVKKKFTKITKNTKKNHFES